MDVIDELTQSMLARCASHDTASPRSPIATQEALRAELWRVARQWQLR